MMYEKDGHQYRTEFNYIDADIADMFYPETQADYQLLKQSNIADSKIDSASISKIKWDEVRLQRQPLLTQADDLVNKATDNGVDLKVYYQYRQALRDIPQKYADPEKVVWPEQPENAKSSTAS